MDDESDSKQPSMTERSDTIFGIDTEQIAQLYDVGAGIDLYARDATV